MTTTTMKWSFDVDAQGWTRSGGGIEVLSFESSLGNPAGCLSNTQTGRNQRGVASWQLSGTWESIFGIPSGSTVDSILTSGDGYETKCNAFRNAALSSAGPVSLFSLGQNTVLIPARSYSSVDSGWVLQVPIQFGQSINQPSNTVIYLFLGAEVITGDHAQTENLLLQDNVVLTVSYT